MHGKAKEQAEIDEEKEIVEMATIQTMGKNKYGNIVKEELQAELNKNLGNGVTDVLYGDDEDYIVKFNQSKRYYSVNSNGDIEYIESTVEKNILTIQCVNSENQILLECKYVVLKNQYSKKAPEISGYMPENETVSGEIKEDKVVELMYYMKFNNDYTLVFTGLDQDGNITDNEDEIVGYMIGDGTTTDGNAILEKKIQGTLEIPDMYKNKPVIKIGSNAFSHVHNIIFAKIGDNVETIKSAAFHTADEMKELVIGKNVKNVDRISFWIDNNLEKVTFKCSNISGAWFGCCDNWKEVIIDSNNEAYKVEDNIIYSKDGNTLVLCPCGRTGDFIIPNSVEIIEANAFYRSILTSIVIPDSVETIKNGSISEVSSLQNIIIGKNLSNITSSSFWHCFSLKMIVVDSNSIINKCIDLKSCGYLVENVKTIYIHESITDIGSYITSNYIQTDSDKTGYIKYIK